MSLEYYLFCRKSFDNIISQLNYTIEAYESIRDYNLEATFTIEPKNLDIFDSQYNINIFIEKKNHIEEMKKNCNKKI